MFDSNAVKKNVLILGLNHSGTTIVWKSFRRNPRFKCFDEPFTGDLGSWFPCNNEKRTFDEYINMFPNDPERFWEIYTPISPLQELDSQFTSEQSHYLNLLVSYDKDVVIDETHLHLHLQALKNIVNNAYIIHLHRRASSFVTSHQRPSLPRANTLSRKILSRLKRRYNEFVFWSRQDILPDMRRGDVIGSHHQSKFGLILTDAGYDSKRIMSSPAIVRMLAYWHYHFHYLERHGPLLFGDKFHSLRYEDFATHPDATMMDLYQWLGMQPPSDVSYSDVHRPKPAFRSNDRRWKEAARIAGFSEDELDALL